jgi:hypothetical protein
MRRHGIFWPIVLIFAGLLLLADNLRLLPPGVSGWELFWPILFIGLGVWILWGMSRGRYGSSRRPHPNHQRADGQTQTGVEATATPASTAVPAELVAIPLADAQRAQVVLHHGAGQLHVTGGAAPDQLLAGEFAGGLKYSTQHDGDLLVADLRTATTAETLFTDCPWTRQGGLAWKVRLNPAIPLALEFETGANEAHLDLSETKVTDLHLKTGASATEVILPASAGYTRVRVEAGAASVKIQVPGGVAARLRLEGALSGTGVDPVRFPKVGAGYESPNYDVAANRVEIEAHSALGSIEVC